VYKTADFPERNTFIVIVIIIIVILTVIIIINITNITVVIIIIINCSSRVVVRIFNRWKNTCNRRQALEAACSFCITFSTSEVMYHPSKIHQPEIF